jgi:glyoxylase-like metal-dependent hydrolase (beta-lactamase superfamily II)
MLFFVLGWLAQAVSTPVEVPAFCKALPRPEVRALHRVTVDDPWFEVYDVAPGVFAILEARQSEETISYLIAGSRQAVLFDTGMGISDIRKVTTQLTKLPIAVMNSHTHYDHVGGNWQFDTVWSMDTEFSRTSAKGSTEAKAEIAPGQVCGALPDGFDAASYATRPWKIAGYKKDGDRIDLGGRTVEVVAAPGHTPDAMSLLDREHGLLFTGDTYYRGTIWLYRPETDLAAYGTSIRRLAALAPQLKLVLGAHNTPVAPPSALPDVAAAYEAVRAGKVAPSKGKDGKVRYKVNDIGFLMRAAQ